MNAIAAKIQILQDKGALRGTDVAELLGARPETVSRWNQGRAFPRSTTERRLLELAYLTELLADFYTPSEVRMWVFAPQKLLDGQTPAALIREGRLSEVTGVIDQLREGVFL